MNYFVLSNKLRRARRRHRLTCTEQALYHELVNVCNESGWKESFPYKNKDLYAALNMSDKGLSKARKTLLEIGLISYFKGGHYQTPVYSLCINLETGELLAEVISELSPETTPSDQEKAEKEVPKEEKKTGDGDKDTGKDHGQHTGKDSVKDTGQHGAFWKGHLENKNTNKKKNTKKGWEVFEVFEKFRQKYPGTRRRSGTEVRHFKKMDKNYDELADRCARKPP